MFEKNNANPSGGQGLSILEKIVANKRKEIAFQKKRISTDDLAKKIIDATNPFSFKKALEISETGIIAEFKRRSPSRGWIFKNAEIKEIVPAYAQSGATAVSVLTDLDFFGGTLADLDEARRLLSIPILRKDFMVDEYQLYEAKASGANCILLIAAALTTQETTSLAQKATELGLDVLLEIHNEKELGHINEYVDVVGVNNRDLTNFATAVEVSFRLGEKIPKDFLKISESGISSPQTVKDLRQAGFKGFLMGENFMKTGNPGQALKTFITQLPLTPPKEEDKSPFEGGFRGAVKVCGMKYPGNINELTTLPIDYMGMIFYDKSPRNSAGFDPKLFDGFPASVKKVGVFVNEALGILSACIKKYQLDAVQLHGAETAAYCQDIKTNYPFVEVIKTFSVSEAADFEKTADYEGHCDYFLFDTKTPDYGGSGTKFDWNLLKCYKGRTPFFLSGGISEEDAGAIKNLSVKNLYGIDVNSKFETAPGLKNINSLKTFIKQLKT
jgi:indole-3-glycerol phosphate synthase